MTTDGGAGSADGGGAMPEQEWLVAVVQHEMGEVGDTADWATGCMSCSSRREPSAVQKFGAWRPLSSRL